MNLLDELIDTYLTNNIGQSYLDLETKQAVYDGDPLITGEEGIDWDDEENIDRYVEIPSIESFQAFRLMELFAAQVNDDKKSDPLFQTLSSSHRPFRKFKDGLIEAGLETEWYAFKYQYAKKEMEDWLEFLEKKEV